MDFDQERFGIQVLEFSRRDATAEAHYSVVLRLSTLRCDEDEVELMRGLPAPETRALLLALRESCDRALRQVDENER